MRRTFLMCRSRDRVYRRYARQRGKCSSRTEVPRAPRGGDPLKSLTRNQITDAIGTSMYQLSHLPPRSRRYHAALEIMQRGVGCGDVAVPACHSNACRVLTHTALACGSNSSARRAGSQDRIAVVVPSILHQESQRSVPSPLALLGSSSIHAVRRQATGQPTAPSSGWPFLCRKWS